MEYERGHGQTTVTRPLECTLLRSCEYLLCMFACTWTTSSMKVHSKNFVESFLILEVHSAIGFHYVIVAVLEHKKMFWFSNLPLTLCIIVHVSIYTYTWRSENLIAIEIYVFLVKGHYTCIYYLFLGYQFIKRITRRFVLTTKCTSAFMFVRC